MMMMMMSLEFYFLLLSYFHAGQVGKKMNIIRLSVARYILYAEYVLHHDVIASKLVSFKVGGLFIQGKMIKI